MSQVKSNLLRIQHTNPDYYKYKIQIYENYVLQQSDHQQLRSFLYQKSPFYLYRFPYLLTVQPFQGNQEIQSQNMKFMLSRGVYVTLIVQLIATYNHLNGIQNTQQFSQMLILAFLKNTEFLYSKKLNACFNPFQEAKISDEQSQIPGFTLQMKYQPVPNTTCCKIMGIYIVPIRLVIKIKQQLNMQNNQKMLLNIHKGKFYNKDQIVRVDKIKNTFHFRNGQILPKQSLKGITLKNFIGYPLVFKLTNYLQRIKETSKQLLLKWNVKLDNRFYDLKSSYVSTGRIAFRNTNQANQQSLGDLVFAVARNTYNHYYRTIFNNILYDDIIDNQLCFIVPKDSMLGQLGRFVQEVKKIIARMGLNNKIGILQYQTLQNSENIIQLLKKYGKPIQNDPNNHTNTHACLHTFITKKKIIKNQTDQLIQNNLIKIKQFMINNGLLFHFLQIDDIEAWDQLDIKAMRFLSINYAKIKMNPWKIKEIPFTQKPGVSISLNVQPVFYQNQEQLSISMVCTMNLFFNKFTAINVKCKPSQCNDIIFFCLKQCLLKFSSVHKIYPTRIFVFRSGFCSQQNNLRQQYKTIRQMLTKFYESVNNAKMNTLTYISLSKKHHLRIYSQTDMNMVTPDTIKKVQLACLVNYDNQNYIQTEFEQPVMKIIIVEKQNDPNFISKVIQLTCKLIYGSVGNEFGKGLGFLQFSAKLNEFKEYNLDGWKSLLYQGYLTFL